MPVRARRENDRPVEIGTDAAHVVEDGKSYKVVFPDGTSVNPGYRVAVEPSYPGIGDDFRCTYDTLASLKPDVWLSPHTANMNFDAELARVEQEGVKAWVDPEGYARFIAAERKKFEATVVAETAKSK